MSCYFMPCVFMSCNFTPCNLVRQFHVLQIHILQFWRYVIFSRPRLRTVIERVEDNVVHVTSLVGNSLTFDVVYDNAT